MIIVFGQNPVGIADIVATARNDAIVEIAPGIYERLDKARGILDGAAASGQQIYGLNTGLGANLKTSVSNDIIGFQQQLVRGRGMGTGASLSRELTRAVMATRLSMLVAGGSGISPSVFTDLLGLLNKQVHPVMPSIGSIGAGDLVLLSALAQGMIGEGSAEYKGQVYSSASALELAGLAPSQLGPKDGLSLLNASAVSVGQGAVVVFDALRLFDLQRQAAALSFEGLGGNPLILAPVLQRARPAAGQIEEAEKLAALLEGSMLFAAKPAIQDPLSLRCIPSIHGALATALEAAKHSVEIELNAAADNPLVIIEEEHVLSTGNFHTPALALAFETLGLAIAQVAAASAARFIQLTGSSRNGLPKYLSVSGGASAGFVPLQKTVVALLAALRHKSNPIMLDFLPVSEGVEDHATQSPQVVSKCAEMVELWRQIVACELLAGAQAVDLKPRHSCGFGTSDIYRFVRKASAQVVDDRALSEDLSKLVCSMIDS